MDESTQIVRIDRGLNDGLTRNHAARCDAARARPGASRPAPPRAASRSAPTLGPPNIMDTAGGRRAGTFEDFCNLVKLCQSFEVIHVLGGATEPQDLAVIIRHLHVTRAQLTLCDKVPFIFSRGSPPSTPTTSSSSGWRTASRPSSSARDLTSTPSSTPIHRCSSTYRCADGIIDFAAAGQVLIVTPFTLAGAMAPVTIAGALTLAHAEFLAGLVLAQIVKPGAPLVYGSFTSNVDMKSGSPAFGTPEYVKAERPARASLHACLGYLGAPPTRRRPMPGRSSRLRVADEPIRGALFGGCNFVLHAAGWLDESGLTTSYEKFILDIEMLQMFAEVFQPVGATHRPISRSRRCRKSAPEGISSDARTPWSAIEALSMRPWSPIGAITGAGPTMAPRPRPNARPASGGHRSQRYVAPEARSPKSSRRSMSTWRVGPRGALLRPSREHFASHPARPHKPPSRFYKSPGPQGTYHGVL